MACPIQVSDGAARGDDGAVVRAHGRRVRVAGGIADAAAGERVEDAPAEEIGGAAEGGGGEVGEAGHGGMAYHRPLSASMIREKGRRSLRGSNCGSALTGRALTGGGASPTCCARCCRKPASDIDRTRRWLHQRCWSSGSCLRFDQRSERPKSVNGGGWGRHVMQGWSTRRRPTRRRSTRYRSTRYRSMRRLPLNGRSRRKSRLMRRHLHLPCRRFRRSGPAATI